MPAIARLGAAPIRRSSSLAQLAVLLFGLSIVFANGGDLKAQSKPGNPNATESQSNSAEAGTTATQEDEAEEAIDQLPEPGDVVIDGRKILSVYQPIGSFTAKDRAQKITERILAAAKERVKPDTVVSTPHPMWTEISGGGKLLLAVSDEDAKAAGKARAELAGEYVESIRQALMDYRRDHNLRAVFRGITYSILVTIALVPIAFIIRKLRLALHGRLEKWIEMHKAPGEKKTAWQIAVTYAITTILAVGSVIHWLVLIALFDIYIAIVLSFFPQTRSVSHAVTGWVVNALQSIGKSALAYLPNLFVVAVVVIIASQLSRLIKMVFGEIKKGNLSIPGFYPEWAEPSAKLIRMMVLVLVIIVVFPYLPGSKSPAFQGISIFVGVLLSLGSSSAVANAIAGIILTYMRSFSVGDWVKIGDTVGEVEERSMLVTRILTQKQETITIPNATVMNGSVMNFTREAMNTGVIFHTTVTIGYDAPWKTIHQLLLDAANGTDGVLRTPAPFVLQTQLNDFYVSYELNAYTDVPRRMQFIYSDLHQNIQDRFNEAGVEICSPHFAALRDGNTIAIPTQYISGDYTAPGFRMHGQEKDGQAKDTRQATVIRS
jgi:small-conductance mechanosensitive channel